MSNNAFKNVGGYWLTKSLFYETNVTDKAHIRFTLKSEDHKGYPSLYRLYMESNDPTEYRFAQEHLGGWEHWQTLQSCGWFKKHIQKWREELEVRLKSYSLAKIMSESKGSGRESFAAAKYLVEKGWEPKDGQGTKRGRPSKQQVKEEAQRIVAEGNLIDDDLNRLTGGKTH